MVDLATFANHVKLGLEGNRGDAMPTRNVNLTEELDRFVLANVDSGRYENASEVIRAALRNLEREEQEFQAKLKTLRSAIDEGDSSRTVRGDPFANVRKRLKLRPPRI
jgi:antitoxin ParD1/3/4